MDDYSELLLPSWLTTVSNDVGAVIAVVPRAEPWVTGSEGVIATPVSAVSDIIDVNLGHGKQIIVCSSLVIHHVMLTFNDFNHIFHKRVAYQSSYLPSCNAPSCSLALSGLWTWHFAQQGKSLQRPAFTRWCWNRFWYITIFVSGFLRNWSELQMLAGSVLVPQFVVRLGTVTILPVGVSEAIVNGLLVLNTHKCNKVPFLHCYGKRFWCNSMGLDT